MENNLMSSIFDGLTDKEIEAIRAQARAYCVSFGCQESDIEDIVQEACLVLCQWPSGRSVKRAVTRAIRSTYGAKGSPKRKALAQGRLSGEETTGMADPTKLVEARETCFRIRNLLSAEEREVVRRLHEGDTQREVAHALGVPYSTLRGKIARMRARLREYGLGGGYDKTYC